VALEIHHRDHDVENNAATNLVPLCKPCHARAGQRRF
jgi:5-methylcytosine-specific restriction endonuclease McrA